MNEIELLIQVQSEPTTEQKKITLPFYYRDNEHSPTLKRLHKKNDIVIVTGVIAYGNGFCITTDIFNDKTAIPAKAVIISQAAFDTVYDAIIDQLITNED